MHQIQLPFQNLGYPPRPTLDDNALDEVVERLFVKLEKAFGNVFPNRHEVIRSLKEAIEYEDDSYRIVKNLEHDGWEGDAELVMVMEQVANLKHDVLDERTHRWVTDNDVKVTYAVGDLVRVKLNNKIYIGNVSGTYPNSARVSVSIPELGHVPVGAKRRTGTLGVIVNVEDVELSPSVS